MKIGLVVGHNSSDKGSYSDYLSASEYDFYSAVADKVVQACKHIKVEVIKREYVGSYSKEMQKVVDYINKNDFDLVLELHYNAFNGSARGVEMLYYHKSKTGKKVADELMDLHNKMLGIPKRRTVPIESSGDRGGYGIVKSSMPYVLTESFFGDNTDDCKSVSADKIANVFIEYLGGNQIDSGSSSKPDESKPVEKPTSDLISKIEQIEKLLKELKEAL